MKITLAILCLLINTFSAYSQELDSNSSFAPIQLEKGNICGIKVGQNLRELLYTDIEAKVESSMAEGDYYFIYHLDIFQCGIVSVQVDDDDNVSRLSTTLTNHSTEEGAKVGMTVRELRNIYPDARLIKHIEGDISNYSFAIDGLGVFTIDGSPIMDQCGDEYPDCEKYMMDLKSFNFFTY